MKAFRYSYALDCTNRHGFFTFKMEELGRKGAFSFVRLEDGTELMMPTRKVFMERHDAHLAGRRSVARISVSAGTGNATHPELKEVQGDSRQTHPRLKRGECGFRGMLRNHGERQKETCLPLLGKQ